MELRIREHLAQRAFQFAHVRAQVLGDEERHVLIQAHAFGLRLAQQNRDAHFQLRRLDRHRQAGVEARDQPVVDARDFLWVRVAGDDHLPCSPDQRLERVEELFLCAALPAKN